LTSSASSREKLACCPGRPQSFEDFGQCSWTAKIPAGHGVDIDEDWNGLLRPLYQLVREHDAIRQRTFEITFLEPGAEAYAFTFG
jgi:hypothetical protein